MKLYIAGPMRGHAQHNFPAFLHAENVLRRLGWDVVSPAQTGDLDAQGTPLFPLSHYLRRDVRDITEVDGVVLLRGWEQSLGVAFEVQVAQGLGLRFFEMHRSGPDETDIELKEVTDEIGSRSWEDERVRVLSRAGR